MIGIIVSQIFKNLSNTMARNIQSKLQMETLIHFLSLKRVIHEDLLSKKIMAKILWKSITFTRRETNLHIFKKTLRHHLYNSDLSKKNILLKKCILHELLSLARYETIRAYTNTRRTNTGPPSLIISYASGARVCAWNLARDVRLVHVET